MIPTDDIELRRARALARVMDTAVGVPGTRLRVGLDAILGLIPGGGDMVAAALSGYIVLAAVRRGAPPAVIWRMLANVGVDTVLGAVPIIGDLFDVAYKSNTRNVELLERFAAEPGEVAKRSRMFGILVAAAFVLLIVGIGYVGFVVARAVWQLLTA